MSTPNAPKPVKTPSNRSKAVQLAVSLFGFAIVMALIAVGLPVLAPVAIVTALIAVGISVLSLREIL